ncbi:hypothetical protein V8G54_003304 [Vigna mungo]|uniref:Reverse transcriptase domain-containing protein n=1 Tax=Vigna mungo TaxID=3915 RepID=A0AAQ3PBU8_VIGMU
MHDIDPTLLSHQLSILPSAKSVAQRKQKLGEKCQAIVHKEVIALRESEFIKEATYTTWPANVGVMKKYSGKWRMCVNYTDLNKACPKEKYPFPYFDRFVDNTIGYKLLSFLNAYSGYNQIRMYPPNKEKIASMTEVTKFCYKVTYQRLMDQVFVKLIRNIMEVYIDNMVIKYTIAADHSKHLQIVFEASSIPPT